MIQMQFIWLFGKIICLIFVKMIYCINIKKLKKNYLILVMDMEFMVMMLVDI